MDFTRPERIMLGQPPRTAMATLLEMLATVSSEDREAIALRTLRDRLAPDAVGAVGGAAKVELYICHGTDPFGPARLAWTVCGDRDLVEMLTVEGDAQPRARGKLDAVDAVPFLYTADRLVADARRLGLTLDDVTGSYTERWSGHFPFPYRMLRIAVRGRALVIATVEAEDFTTHPSPVVLSITLYRP